MRKSWTSVLFLSLVLMSSAACRADTPTVPVSVDTSRSAAVAQRGMVVAGQADAAQIGADVLKDGGNAVDAAVAVGFALAVTLPNAGNVGGGGFMLVRFEDGTTTSLDFRERAPSAATRTMYVDPLTDQVRPDLSTRGHLAVGVPGTVAGLLHAHEQHGRLPLSRLIEPAIELAARGFFLSNRQARLFNGFQPEFSEFESTMRYFSKPDGASYVAGERFVQADLADVLRRIRDQGFDGFYKGRTADLIVAEMERGGGLITHEDLAAYEPIERSAVFGSYRDHHVISMAPPSSGGVSLIQMLKSVEPFPLRAMGRQSAEAMHLMGEAMRRAYADRSHWMGDPAYAEVPTEALMDADYVASRMTSFTPERVSSSEEVGHGTPPGLPDESSETTHYSIVDAAGNAVAVTYTINDLYGSKLVVDGAGFFLNDEMDDFTSAPGEPNLWGLIQGERNAVTPGARPVSSMTPTILEDPEGRLFMVVGSPGGARIITTVFQVITNVIDYDMDIQAAVAAPRFHHQWLPEDLQYEQGIPSTQLSRLEELGWTTRPISTFGAADAILVEYDRAGVRTLHGGADPRREMDTAVGF